MEKDTGRWKNFMIDVFGFYLLFQVASVHGTQLYKDKKKFTHCLSVVRFLVKKITQILCGICPMVRSFQGMCHHLMVQRIKCLNHGTLIITHTGSGNIFIVLEVVWIQQIIKQ